MSALPYHYQTQTEVRNLSCVCLESKPFRACLLFGAARRTQPVLCEREEKGVCGDQVPLVTFLFSFPL